MADIVKIWHDLPVGTPPDQLYFWAVPGAPCSDLFRRQLPDASDQVRMLIDHLMEKVNPWLAARGYIGFQRLPGMEGQLGQYAFCPAIF